jgi:hypothetical protein
MAGREANEHGLRDRVAEVLRDFVPAMRPGEVAWCADAVIAELGLRVESYEGGYLTRWVTDWRFENE